MSTNTITPYLTFMLEKEMFSFDVSKVREVLDMGSITRVPGAPDYMKGIVNVRGTVVPVVDLRVKFGMAKAEHTHDSRIVVLELQKDTEMLVLGIMADSVHEVCELDPGEIVDPPKIGARWKSDFIKGIGKKNDQFIIILDIDRVLSEEELEKIDVTV